jgi:hypothetical protein
MTFQRAIKGYERASHQEALDLTRPLEDRVGLCGLSTWYVAVR